MSNCQSCAARAKHPDVLHAHIDTLVPPCPHHTMIWHEQDDLPYIGSRPLTRFTADTATAKDGTRFVRVGHDWAIDVKHYADVVMFMIAEDVRSGVMPPDVFTFSCLHDYVDANMYLLEAVPDKGDESAEVMFSEEHTDLCNAISDEVNSRLVAREISKGRQISAEDSPVREIITQCGHRFMSDTDAEQLAGLTVPCGQAGCEFYVKIGTLADVDAPVIYAEWDMTMYLRKESV